MFEAPRPTPHWVCRATLGVQASSSGPDLIPRVPENARPDPPDLALQRRLVARLPTLSPSFASAEEPPTRHLDAIRLEATSTKKRALVVSCAARTAYLRYACCS